MNDNIKTGADINAGDGGYSLGTQEKYDEFVKGRNQSLGKMRIKELAEQAEDYADGIVDQGGEFHPAYTQKLAELIVRECANHCDLLLDHKISSEWSRGTHDCSRAIKQHFGVEEC